MTVVFALLVLAVITVGVLILVKAPTTQPLDSNSAARALVADSLPEPVTAHDLRQVRLPIAFRGYRMDEVDALLARLGDQLSAADPPTDPAEPREAPPPAEAPPVPPPPGTQTLAPPPPNAAPPVGPPNAPPPSGSRIPTETEQP